MTAQRHAGNDLPAVIVDCDGVLIDTDAAWHAAIKTVFPGNGDFVLGSSVAQIVDVNATAVAADREALTNRLTNVLADAVSQLGRELPGASAFLERLRHRRCAIASNAPPRVVRQALAHLNGAANGIEIVALEPPLKPKPAPDLHLEACRRLLVSPAHAIALEDSVLGTRAARAAGLYVIGVGTAEDLTRHAATVVSGLDDERLVPLLRNGLRPANG